MRKEYRRKRAMRRFIKYLHNTWKNKLMAMFMVFTGMMGVMILDDATALVFMLFIAVPMFFSRKDWTC